MWKISGEYLWHPCFMRLRWIGWQIFVQMQYQVRGRWKILWIGARVCGERGLQRKLILLRGNLRLQRRTWARYVWRVSPTTSQIARKQTDFSFNYRSCVPSGYCGGIFCAPNAVCLWDNVQNVQYCECSEGFVGEGWRSCKSVPPPCNVKNNCGLNAQCTPAQNNMYECTCNSGFYGDGFICVPELNCANTPALCHEQGRCVSTKSGYQCVCNSGRFDWFMLRIVSSIIFESVIRIYWQWNLLQWASSTRFGIFIVESRSGHCESTRRRQTRQPDRNVKRE